MMTHEYRTDLLAGIVAQGRAERRRFLAIAKGVKNSALRQAEKILAITATNGLVASL